MPGDRPIAYVMEQTLGSITHYLNLRREEGQAGGPKQWLPVEFQHTRLPWAISGSLLARKEIAKVGKDVDGIFIHTTTLALCSPDWLARRPTVLSSDATPASKEDMRELYGLKPESRLAARAKRAVYRAVFRRAAGFVAWSSWAKQSFVDDYGCREEDVAVIPPGIDVQDFAPGDRAHELPRILFVGGDFLRKGGDLLLEVFDKRLKGRAELVLVTRDEVAERPGVTLHKNVGANSEKLRQLYATSDVFALPTRADCYSMVCMEALAAGMPIVTTDIGGLPDIINEGVTGRVVAPDDAGSLGDALEELVADPKQRLAMGVASRADAEQRFEVRTNARRLFEFVRSRC